MIAKLPTRYGKGFRGVLNYVLDQHRHRGAEVTGGTMAGRSPRDLAREFAFTRSLRPEVQGPVFHYVIAYDTADAERVSQDDREAIARRIQEELGLEASRHDFVRVSHLEKAHQHDHIIASRIGLDGELWEQAWRAGQQLQPALRDIEREFGLRALGIEREAAVRQPDLSPTLRALEADDAPTAKGAIRDAMVSALAEVRRGGATREPEQNLEMMRAALERRGLLLHVHSSQSTGRVQGYSIGLQGADGQPATFSDGRETVWKASALGFRGRKALDAQVRLPERSAPDHSEERRQAPPPHPTKRRGGPER
jgi:hypothetical protein